MCQKIGVFTDFSKAQAEGSATFAPSLPPFYLFLSTTREEKKYEHNVYGHTPSSSLLWDM